MKIRVRKWEQLNSVEQFLLVIFELKKSYNEYIKQIEEERRNGNNPINIKRNIR